MVTDTVAEVDTENAAPSRMYLLSALVSDSPKALKELNDLVVSLGSNIEKAEDLGARRLAFAVNGHRQLSLVSVFFKTDRQTIKTLEGELRHAETIERFLLSSWRASLEDPKQRASKDSRHQKVSSFGRSDKVEDV